MAFWLFDYFNKRVIELSIKDDKTLRFKCSKRAKYPESFFLLVYEYDGIIKVINIIIPKNQKEGVISFNSSFSTDKFIIYSLNFRVKCTNTLDQINNIYIDSNTVSSVKILKLR